MCERGARGAREKELGSCERKELGSCERKELGCKRFEREVDNLYFSLECLGVRERGAAIARSWTMQETSG